MVGSIQSAQKAIYKWYISGIYCQLGDYTSPTTFTRGTGNNYWDFHHLPPSTTWRIIPFSNWLVTTIYKANLGRLEWEQPYLGDLVTMVTNHLRVLGWSSKHPPVTAWVSLVWYCNVISPASLEMWNFRPEIAPLQSPLLWIPLRNMGLISGLSKGNPWLITSAISGMGYGRRLSLNSWL